MTPADWSALIGAIIALLGALAAWLQASAAARHSATAQKAANGAAASVASGGSHDPPNPVA